MLDVLGDKFSSHAPKHLVLAAALLIASAGAAAAKEHHHAAPADAHQYYGLAAGGPAGALSMDQIDHRLFDRSGTVGREGLGGSPRHPEGPGDVSD